MTRGEDAAAQPVDKWRVNFTPNSWGPDIKTDVRVKDEAIDFDVSFKGLEKDKYNPRASGMYFETFRPNWGGIVRLEFREADMTAPELKLKQVDITTIVIDAMGAPETVLTLRGTTFTFVPYAGIRFRDHEQFIRYTDESEAEAEHYSLEPVFGARVEWQINKWLALGAMADASGFGAGGGPARHTILLGEAKVHLSKEFSRALGYRYDEFEIDGQGYAMDGTMRGPDVAPWPWISGATLHRRPRLGMVESRLQVSSPPPSRTHCCPN